MARQSASSISSSIPGKITTPIGNCEITFIKALVMGRVPVEPARIIGAFGG